MVAVLNCLELTQRQQSLSMRGLSAYYLHHDQSVLPPVRPHHCLPPPRASRAHRSRRVEVDGNSHGGRSSVHRRTPARHSLPTGCHVHLRGVRSIDRSRRRWICRGYGVSVESRPLTESLPKSFQREVDGPQEGQVRHRQPLEDHVLL